MGQYYIIANLDREQYLNPHKFGDGLKLMEFGNSSCGTLLGLAVLLADGNGRGGGDLQSDSPIVGSWAGDRIVVAGDYADGIHGLDVPEATLRAVAEEAFTEEYQDPEHVNVYTLATSEHTDWADVSAPVIRAIADGEGERHPLAHVDLAEDGWRSRPSFAEAHELAQEKQDD